MYRQMTSEEWELAAFAFWDDYDETGDPVDHMMISYCFDMARELRGEY